MIPEKLVANATFLSLDVGMIELLRIISVINYGKLFLAKLK